MATKRRLGRTLSDLLAEENRIDANRALNQLIPATDPESHGGEDGTVGSQFEIIPGAEKEWRKDSGRPVEFVEDAKPPKYNYGQGPERSTRVAAHKFVPNLTARAGIPGIEVMGTVYVRFQPNMQGKRANDMWEYRNVPQSIYDDFSNSNSKGRFINTHLNSYPKGRVKSRDGRFHIQDLKG